MQVRAAKDAAELAEKSTLTYRLLWRIAEDLTAIRAALEAARP